MSDTETSQSMLFWFSVFMLVGAGLLMPFDWQTPDIFDSLLFALLAVSATLGQYCVIQAFRYGQVSLLAPLEYSALIWATSFGFLFWGEFPTPTVLLGAVVIILSSLYVVQREALAAAARGLTAKDRLRIFRAHDRERGSGCRRRRVVGLAIARALAQAGRETLILEGRRSHRQRDLLAQQRGDPCRHLLPRRQPEGPALRRRPRHAL
jgi:Permeases of the drug/metabolite transporter (DMT) superfamily